MRHRMKACKPHQSLSTQRNPSTHRAALHRRRCKLHQASTRILVSRWSARLGQVRIAFSLPRRLQLSSKCRSTFYARRAPRAVLSTGVSSTRSGSRRVPSPPSHAPGTPRNGRTRDAKPAL